MNTPASSLSNPAMKEIAKVPVKVQCSDRTVEVYEYEYGFAMTAEHLGRKLGYEFATDSMNKLFSRNKKALEPHRFKVTTTFNPLGGRPQTFYDLRGCIKAAAKARTPESKVLHDQLIDIIAELEALRIAHIERYWFGKRPFWAEVRERVMLGQSFREIAEAMVRSTASVRNAVRRMIEVGILQPMRAAQALTGTAKKAVIRYSRKFSDDRQLLLPGLGLQPAVEV